MGQRNSEEGDYFCDKCEEKIDGERYHCQDCEGFDLCYSCKEKNVSVRNHDSSHKLVKVVTDFPLDLHPEILKYVTLGTIKRLLRVSKEFHDSILTRNTQVCYENIHARMFSSPKEPKPYVGSLKVCVTQSDEDVFPPEVAKLFSNLVNLELNVVALKDEVFQNLPHLKILRIKPKCIKDESVETGLLHGVSDITGKAFEPLKELKTLYLDYTHFSRHPRLHHKLRLSFFEYMGNLEELHIIGGELPVLYNHPVNLNSLRILELRNTRVDSKWYGCDLKDPSFEKLVEEYQNDCGKAVYDHLFQKMKNSLEELRFVNMGLQNFKIDCLRILANLKVLHVDLLERIDIHNRNRPPRFKKEDFDTVVPKACIVAYRRNVKYFAMCL